MVASAGMTRLKSRLETHDEAVRQGRYLPGPDRASFARTRPAEINLPHPGVRLNAIEESEGSPYLHAHQLSTSCPNCGERHTGLTSRAIIKALPGERGHLIALLFVCECTPQTLRHVGFRSKGGQVKFKNIRLPKRPLWSNRVVTALAWKVAEWALWGHLALKG